MIGNLLTAGLGAARQFLLTIGLSRPSITSEDMGTIHGVVLTPRMTSVVLRQRNSAAILSPRVSAVALPIRDNGAVIPSRTTSVSLWVR